MRRIFVSVGMALGLCALAGVMGAQSRDTVREAQQALKDKGFDPGPIDGTVVPSAAGGSLPFLPYATLRVLKNIKDRYGQAWSRYGFVNAFNPLTKWYDADVIGIDTGITMLMAENLRTGFVWETFMRNPEAKRGFDRAGFKTYEADYRPEQQRLEALKHWDPGT